MRVFVIGNAALDETLSITDFPQPGASIFGRLMSRDLGGKGLNQAVALARTGLDCTLTAAVGADGRGREIAARLASEPVAADLVSIADVGTDFSTILMTGDENAIITTREAATSLTPDQVRRALAPAQPGDLLVLQGNLTLAANQAALEMAQTRGMQSALNPSPLQDGFAPLWGLVHTAFVNEGEAEALGGIAALREAGVERVVLTLGDAGAALIDATGRIDAPAHPCDVVDTTGAGDCFMAVALASAALRRTALDARALDHASRAAAHTVGRPGTVTAFPDRAEMAAILAM
ncbi:ribokinase [Paracoccus sp. Z330]|uniref:Ribokinase n=1 Tax=Paracoccus onchidii TaxID=3017813 RepID=A0ABT4ZAC7_9RHOB|nr:ribokinase [Paracoccus onchidii]MDB6176306.1 ribokinase [Paracoccus onchidii]